MKKYKMSDSHAGQGVVEYSGAMIVAVLLVATVMGGGVNGLSGLFGNIITAAHNMLIHFVPA